MEIREFKPEDKNILAKIYTDCFREPPWLEEFGQQEVGNMFIQVSKWLDTIFLVAEHKGEIVGGAIAYDLARKEDVAALVPASTTDRAIYMAELFVEKPCRNCGVGRSLIIARLALAKMFGYANMVARTSIDQPIIKHLYCNRLGATVVAEQKVSSYHRTQIVERQKVMVPDQRLIMAGRIPEEVLVETLLKVWPLAQRKRSTF